MYDARGRGSLLPAEHAVTEAEVEGGARHDDEVGPAERGPARLGHE